MDERREEEYVYLLSLMIQVSSSVSYLGQLISKLCFTLLDHALAK